MKELIASLLVSMLAAWATYAYGLKFSYSDIKDYGSSLFALSGMIFTIMGIWIAFIYPNALLRLQAPSKIKNADFSQTLEDTKRLQSIVGCVLKSVFVASVLCVIFLLKIIISSIPFYKEYSQIIKAGVMGVIVFLTILQGSAVASVMYANFMFVEDLHSKREKKEGDNDF
ncbi:hypothetical protein JM49_26305 [Pseudomonas chlororaphis subsp. aurantiaca]|uniref:hypothetical protein n=1 Tax=Pseudomonas chlororaphis TaxID=587753 RepID=UPI00050D5D6A|nr:hypothetical protein [Pseudomonas chlororaphis]AIS15060.1 hypothetical protein JM49_26305 [Pseudomonas chlororaphis subsp. aurantiaca]